jgi:hypothetical protein
MTADDRRREIAEILAGALCRLRDAPPGAAEKPGNSGEHSLEAAAANPLTVHAG